MAGKRMLHKNICISEKISQLTWFQECLFYRLLVCSDDHGMFFSRASTVKEICFPRNQLSARALNRGLNVLIEVGLVVKVVHENRSILVINDWSKYQILRKDREKHSFFGIPDGLPPDIPPDIPEDKAKDKAKDQVGKAPAKAGTPQAEFVAAWGKLYQSETGRQFKANNKDFILMDKLLKDFGVEEVYFRSQLLFKFCKNKSAWFTKGGMADFTIGKLSSQWNSILSEVEDHGKQVGVSKGELAAFLSGRE